MKKFIILLAFIIFSGTVSYGQLLVDTTVKVDKDAPTINAGKRAYAKNDEIAILGNDTIARNGLTAEFVYLINSRLKVAIPDSVKIYFSHFDSVKTWATRNTVSYLDTLSADSTYRTYSFEGQYLHVLVSIKRLDTNVVVWDSVWFYNINEFGDTSAISARYLQGVQDSNLVRVNWTATARNSSREFLIYHPALYKLHVRLENYALQDRKVKVGVTGAK